MAKKGKRKAAAGDVATNRRASHKYTLVERSSFVPRTGEATPIPDWKRSDWACDVLAGDDPARGGEH